MAARTVSELANWDGLLDQQRQNSKWRHSSSNLSRDLCHEPRKNQSFEVFQPPGKFSDQKRTEQFTFRPNLERASLASSSANARLSSRIDTTSTSSHRHHHPSMPHTVPNPRLPSSPFITSSRSSHFTPNSSAHASRAHKSRPPSSHEHVASLRRAPTIESEVIDLTAEDTEDGLSISDMLVPNNMRSNNKHADPGPSRRPLSSGHSSPVALEGSLFTPPPPPRRRHTRLFMDHLAVPSFPKGLTKADYQPLSLPRLTVASTSKGSSVTESSATVERPPSVQKWKGKEREHDVVPPRKKYERRPPTPNELLDGYYEPKMIPLYDDHTYPPLTTLDLATNTRFRFAHAWRGHASRLREAELDWMSNFRLLGKPCILLRSVDTLSPSNSGTTGWFSSEQLRSWELVPPDSTSQAKNSRNEQAHTTELSVVEADADSLSVPDDALLIPSVSFDPTPSSSVSESLSSTTIDMEHDMNQYFNGLSDSPNKHVPPRQQLAPFHPFRPHLLQSAGHAQANSVETGFSFSDFDPRLADTGGHECFLGVPPSPIAADIESIAPGFTSDSPFEPVNYFTASPSNPFADEVPTTGVWSFEQGEDLLPLNNSPFDDLVPPTALGTIDPSLLGLEQPQTPSLARKDATPKRRSKLPDPVIYMRRPVDSSTLPLVSGKRPVRIKYRDPEGSLASSSTRPRSREVSSNLVDKSIELPTNNTDDSLPAKRRSAPSRKLREYHTASESDSAFIPEASKSNTQPKTKPKPKQSSGKDKESIAGHQDAEDGIVPAMSFCHQCRNRTSRPKMSCSNMIEGRVCGKRFCARCILYRYPDVTFDQNSEGFLCPVCTNTCNCSVCSRNRGEEFVSMRLGGLAASIFKTKVTLVRDAGSPRKVVPARRNTSAVTTPTPEPSAQPMQSQFWAHVYGLEGERMGTAFMTNPTSAPPHGLPRPPQPPPKKVEKTTRRRKKQEVPRGPRVFIGRPLASWKVRAVRDLEPSVDVETTETTTIQGKGKDKASTGSTPARRVRRRWFIGNPIPLYETYRRMPRTASPTPPSPYQSSRCSSPIPDSDGSFTPLSEVEADVDHRDWPQPEVGEFCSWAPSSLPGTIIARGHSSDVSGLSGSFVKGSSDLGLDGSGSGSGAAAGGDAVGPQHPNLDLGSSAAADADVDMGEVDVDVDANGEEGESRSASTVLSEQDIARAIIAALEALTVEPSSS